MSFLGVVRPRTRTLGPRLAANHTVKGSKLFHVNLFCHPPGDEEVNVKGLEPFHGVAVRSTRILGSSHLRWEDPQTRVSVQPRLCKCRKYKGSRP